MAHYIPTDIFYVEKITVTNGGSNYTTVPTVTISGGGGTGATAEASLTNGRVTAVYITNPGDGYKTTPTATVSGGGGSGAVLAVQINSAAQAVETYQTKEKIFLQERLPAHIKTNYPKFIKFLETYYDYMDAQYSELLHPLLGLTGTYQEQWINQTAVDFPRRIEATNKELFYSRIRDIYEAKGTEAAIKTFFRAVYGETVEIEKPQDKILIASGGQWQQSKTLRVTEGDADQDPLKLEGRLINLNYYETIGTATFLKSIPAVVTAVSKIAYLFPNTYDISFEFSNQTDTTVPGPGAGYTFGTPTLDGSGAITSVPITNGGAEFLAAPSYVITDSGTPTSEAELSIRVEDGKISEIVIVDGGSGYTDPEVILNTDPIRTFITLSVDDPHEDGVRCAYVGRVLSNISNITYAGSASEVGFEVGQLYVVNEAGADNLGYALDYFGEDYVFIGGVNEAVVKVSAVDSMGVPTAFEILNPGSNFFNVSTEVALASPLNEIITFTLTTSYFFNPPGVFLNQKGFLSDVNVLQDNNRYQAYSYIVKSGLSKNLWDNALKEAIHPSGIAFFGDIALKTKLDFASNFGVEPKGTLVTKILTDGVSIFSDEFSTALTHIDTFKVLTETSSVSISIPTLTVDLVKTETVTVSESLVKSFSTGRSDTSTATDDFSRVVAYVRQAPEFSQFAETVTVTDDLFIGKNLVFEDTFNASEAKEISFNQGTQTENQTASDSINNILLSKAINENKLATESINFINTSKALNDTATTSEATSFSLSTQITDTAIPSDAGNAVSQDYVEGAYFADIFIGSGATF